jgi:hypothetical protein
MGKLDPFIVGAGSEQVAMNAQYENKIQDEKSPKITQRAFYLSNEHVSWEQKIKV